MLPLDTTSPHNRLVECDHGDDDATLSTLQEWGQCTRIGKLHYRYRRRELVRGEVLLTSLD